MTSDTASRHSKPIIERRFPRFLLELPCLYSKEAGVDGNGTAVNLSRRGCAVLGLLPVREGDCLRIRLLPSPTLPPIEISTAQVRWAIDGYFGVEFITLTFRDAKRLLAYLTLIATDEC